MLIARSSHEGRPGQRRDVNVWRDVTGVCIEQTGEEDAVGNGYAKAMHFWLPTCRQYNSTWWLWSPGMADLPGGSCAALRGLVTLMRVLLSAIPTIISENF